MGAPGRSAEPEPLPEEDFSQRLRAKPTAAMQRVLDDPAIKAARESGRLGRLQWLLRAKRRASSDAETGRAVDYILADRRLLLSTRHAQPVLFTWNGCGLKFLGREEHDRYDDTYITTLWLTLAFLPIWPLGQYLVRRIKKGEFDIHGKVPMAGLPRLFRPALLVALLLVGVFAGIRSTLASSFSDVHFVNALNTTVRLEIDGRRFDLAAGKREKRTIRVGEHRIRTLDPTGGTVRDERVEVPAHHDLIAYNVVGAAPLELREFVYYEDADRFPSPTLNETVRLCGQTLVVRRTVHYVFENRPRSIEWGADGDSGRRFQVRVAEGNWETSLRVLLAAEKLEQAASLARSVALLDPDHPTAARTAAVLEDRLTAATRPAAP